MKRVLISAIPVLFVLGTNGFGLAQDATTPQSATAPVTLSTSAPSQDDPNAVICRKGEPPTGSRFPGPTQCHTRAEWDRLRLESRDETMHFQATSSEARGRGN